MANNQHRVSKLESASGSQEREKLTIFYNPEMGYYRLPDDGRVDYRQVLSGAGAIKLSAAELVELKRKYDVITVRWVEYESILK